MTFFYSVDLLPNKYYNSNKQIRRSSAFHQTHILKLILPYVLRYLPNLLWIHCRFQLIEAKLIYLYDLNKLLTSQVRNKWITHVFPTCRFNPGQSIHESCTATSDDQRGKNCQGKHSRGKSTVIFHTGC